MRLGQATQNLSAEIQFMSQVDGKKVIDVWVYGVSLLTDVVATSRRILRALAVEGG